MITKQLLTLWSEKFYLKSFKGCSSEQIKSFEHNYVKIPEDLKQLYLLSNGLESNNFKILPLFDEKDITHTWDSIERANKIETSKYRLTREILNKFIVFGEISGLNVIMFSKDTENIWFEDEEGFHETDISLQELIRDLVEEKE